MTTFDTSQYRRLILTVASVVLSSSLPLARGQCLSTLSEFDANVTSDRDNVDKLTGGFYPTNRPSPLVADICYYVNVTSASEVPKPREASFQVRIRALINVVHIAIRTPQLTLSYISLHQDYYVRALAPEHLPHSCSDSLSTAIHCHLIISNCHLHFGTTI